MRRGVAGGGFVDQVVGLGQQVAGAGEDLDARRGGGDVAARAVQQADAEGLLQGEQGAGDGCLGEAEFDGGVGEAAGVDDRHEATEMA